MKPMDILGSIFGRLNLPPFQDPPHIHEQHQQIKLEETLPLDKEIILGPRFPSRKAERQIIEAAIGLLLGHVKGMETSVTFHFKNGTCFDVRIGKPYKLRSWRGCIVKVYD